MSTHKFTCGDSSRAVIRSAGIIGFATLCSRILGFIRDVVIARLFGVYIYAQAFVIAFKVPNLLRDLVGEGASNAAFVPVFSEYTVKHSREEFWELANVVLNLLLVILTALSVLGVVFAPLIVRLIAPGFAADPHKLGLTIKLTQIVFPYILLISLAAYAMGILNSLRHFSLPAFAPCFLNISIIVFALLFGEGIKGLALGVLVGGALQLVVQVPALYRRGFRLRLFRRFRHPAAEIIMKLMVPRLASSAIYQLNNFVDSIFGSLAWIVGEGGVAVLYFSYRLIQFPLGIFSNALSQAVLPEFSTRALEDNYAKLSQMLSFSLRAVFFVMLPASCGFMVLAYPIISTLFGGGKFDAYSANLTAKALFFYSIGLSAYGATKILQCCFFALKDTVTPTKVTALALIANIILNFVLMFPLKIAGLALATSLSGIGSFLALFVILKRKLGGIKAREIAASLLRILCAAAAMSIVCYFSFKLGSQNLTKLLNLSLAIVSGILSYIVFCFIFQVREMWELWQWWMAQKTHG